MASNATDDRMKSLLEQLESHKIVPVIEISNAEDAPALGQALCDGGLPVAEITFRTETAEKAIGKLAAARPDMLVGAGSISTVRQAEAAEAAGCSFFVTAGFNRKVTEYAVSHKIPILPGICTPTELMLLLEYDLPVAKFFPAKQYGGVNTIKALSAPFPKMRFMPTGGINAENVLEYLAFPKVIACGGSWMASAGMIQEHRFDTIRERTAEAVNLVKNNR